MYKNFSLQDDTGQGSNFFKLLDNLIGEHQALQKQRDILAKANMELQQHLTSSIQTKYCMSGIPEDIQVDKSSMQNQVWASKDRSTSPSGQVEHSDIDVAATLGSFDESQNNTPHTTLQQSLPSRETALSQNSVSVVGESKVLCAHAAGEKKNRRVTGYGVKKVAKGDDMMSGSIVAQSIRVQARLGVKSDSEMLTPERLHSSITNLGLMKFDLAEITALMKALKQVLHPEECQPRLSTPITINPGLARVFTPLSLQRTTFRLLGIEIRDCRTPPAERDCDMVFKEFSSVLLEPSTAAVPLDEHQTLLTIREVLISAEANALVAELTNVRIDDLASPPPPRDLLTKLEPLVNFMILANGIVVGIQTDSINENWLGWILIEIVFVSFFTCETSLRMYIQGIRNYFGGGDSGWNAFDTIVISISIADLSLTLFYTTGNSDMPLTLFRLIRLLRLSRMMRLLRFKSAQELALMIRGLMGGFRTLCWATVMLVFAIYVIAVLVRSLVKHRVDVPSNTGDLLSSVTGAMFTSFRCFTGDCTDKNGDSIPIVLESILGTPFVLGYCVCVMMVTFGFSTLSLPSTLRTRLKQPNSKSNSIRRQGTRKPCE